MKDDVKSKRWPNVENSPNQEGGDMKCDRCTATVPSDLYQIYGCQACGYSPSNGSVLSTEEKIYWKARKELTWPSALQQIDEMIEGLIILKKYNSCANIGADHDIIYCSAGTMSQEDQAALDGLGWFVDEESGGYAKLV